MNMPIWTLFPLLLTLTNCGHDNRLEVGGATPPQSVAKNTIRASSDTLIDEAIDMSGQNHREWTFSPLKPGDTLEIEFDHPAFRQDGITTIERNDGVFSVFKPRQDTQFRNCTYRYSGKADFRITSPFLNIADSNDLRFKLIREDQSEWVSSAPHLEYEGDQITRATFRIQVDRSTATFQITPDSRPILHSETYLGGCPASGDPYYELGTCIGNVMQLDRILGHGQWVDSRDLVAQLRIRVIPASGI